MKRTAACVVAFAVACSGGRSRQVQRKVDDLLHEPEVVTQLYETAYGKLVRESGRPWAPFYCFGMPGETEVPLSLIARFARNNPAVRPMAACMRPEWKSDCVSSSRERPVMLYAGPPTVVGSDTVELIGWVRSPCEIDSMRTVLRLRFMDGRWQMVDDSLLWIS